MNPALHLAAPLLALVSATQPVVQPVTQPALPAPIPDPDAPTPEQLAFTDNGVRMTVPVTIAEAGPYRFIVDTGSERTVISRELAGTLGLAPGRGVRMTAMTGTTNVATVVIPRIDVAAQSGRPGVGGLRIEAPALIERNLGAAGLLGIDTLQGHAVTIDFDQQVMAVAPATKRRHPERFGPDDIVIHARNLYGQLVVTDAFYRGRRIKVIIDTGSVVSMGNLAMRRLVARNTSQLQKISLLSVTGAIMQADYSQVDKVEVGEIGFANLPVAFADAAPFARLGLTEQPALLLGMDALRLFHRVRIDFANREVRLSEPRPGATAP